MVGDNVTYETNGTDKIYYSYDSTGNLVSMNLNGTEYYYIRNAQGDIIGLLDGTGAQVVSYTYDSWGKLISTTGSLSATVGVKKPYRYRGYRYDTETGLFYVGSRYYDPETGRFINADTIENGDDLLSGNLFAYCTNNPVNHSDPDGAWKLPNWAKIGIGAVAIAGALALTAVTGGAATPLLIGVAVSVASSAAIGGALGYATGGINGMKKGLIDGACDGFMWGGLGTAGAAVGRTVQIAKNGVVIGESMGRVNKAAKGIKAATYKGMPGYKTVRFFKGENFARKLSMAHNEAWVKRMMNWGVKITDIGLDTTRTTRSPYYFMESVLTRGYSGLRMVG